MTALTHAPMSREAVNSAATELRHLIDRNLKAVAALTRLAVRIATEDRPARVLPALQLYAKSGLPDAEAVADLMITIEGSQPVEWQQKRREARLAALKQNARDRLRFGRDLEPPPEWTVTAVMQQARRRRDVISAAIAVHEQGRDGNSIVIKALGEYLSGEITLGCVEYALERVGYSVDGARVVPLIPRERRA